MTASPAATPLPTAPRPISLYEGIQGELYLRRDELAYPVHGGWPQRHAALHGQGSLFALDAQAWNENPPPPDDIARQLGQNLSEFLRAATWHPGGRVELHRNNMRPGARAYLGNAAPAAPTFGKSPVESTAAVPKRGPSTPDEATPYDGFPKGYQRQPEVEVRIAFDVLLGLYRESDTTILGEGGWMLAATDSAGVFLTSWGKGTGDVPAAVWHLAAEAAHRHHLDKHGSL